MNEQTQTAAPTLLARLLAFPERTVEALNDPARQTRTLILLLVGFVVLWTVYGVLAQSHHDADMDIGEAIGWSRYSEGQHHPPIIVWIVGWWFTLFPRVDWLIHLLAYLTVGLTLWIAWVLFGDWLEGNKRIAALAMLATLPHFTLLGMKPNANLIMLPFWAAATLFFLRSVVRRDAMSSALAGASLAGAILTKLWTVYLGAAFVLAALLDGRRVKYLTSAAPWIASAMAVALLLPYALSLWQRPATVMFAMNTMTGETHAQALLRSLRFLYGIVAYAAPALIVVAALRPSRRAFYDIIVPDSQDRRLIAMVFWLPLILPAIANVFAPHRLTAVWTFPDWTLLPVVLLGSPLIVVSGLATARVLAFAMILPFVGILIGPAIAAINFHRAGDIESHYYRAVAELAEADWRSVSDQPLRFIGGEHYLVRGSTFYLQTGAQNFAPQNQIEAGAAPVVPAEGIVVACMAHQTHCVAVLDAFARQAGGRRFEHELTRRYLGMTSAGRVVVLVVPPKR